MSALKQKVINGNILKHLKKVRDKSDKTSEADYFEKKIKNCRDKYDKADPAPLREKFMHNIIFIKKAKKYFDNSTKGSYDKEAIETTYAHNSRNLVKVGQRVKKGKVIAKVGRTGNATGYHLHFEIRQRGKAINPKQYLPSIY